MIIGLCSSFKILSGLKPQRGPSRAWSTDGTLGPVIEVVTLRDCLVGDGSKPRNPFNVAVVALALALDGKRKKLKHAEPGRGYRTSSIPEDSLADFESGEELPATLILSENLRIALIAQDGAETPDSPGPITEV